jgi:hypothetical protein
MIMKKDIAIKWIDALRSGKYKQGKSELHNSDTNEYCCLGVLNEICELKSDLYRSQLIEREVELSLTVKEE